MKKTSNGKFTAFWRMPLPIGSAFVCMACCLFLIPSFPCSYSEALADDQIVSRPIDSGPALADAEKAPGWMYNSDYIYSISRAVRDSSLPEAGKVPLFIPSIIIDTALLPIALLAGLLG